jgi:hypothetical protein
MEYKLMRDLLLSVAVLAGVGFFIGGCSSGGSSQPAATATPAQPAVAEPTEQPIPFDSPLAKIKDGMSQDEVFGIIGRPNSLGTYVTGKAFIPFNYGGDKFRQIAHYKGIGYIIFSQDSSFNNRMDVSERHYDPNDTGY